VVEALGDGKRPAVAITINGRPWKSRIAIMRGRYLLGLSGLRRHGPLESGRPEEAAPVQRGRAPAAGGGHNPPASWPAVLYL